MPSRTKLLFAGPNTVPFLTTHTLLAAASLRRSPRNITVSVAFASKLICRANTAPNRLVDLMWARSQRKSSAVTQVTPLYTRFVDVWDAVQQLVEMLQNAEWKRPEFNREQVVT